MADEPAESRSRSPLSRWARNPVTWLPLRDSPHLRMEAALLWDTVARHRPGGRNSDPRNLTAAVTDNMLLIVEAARGARIGITIFESTEDALDALDAASVR